MSIFSVCRHDEERFSFPSCFVDAAFCVIIIYALMFLSVSERGGFQPSLIIIFLYPDSIKNIFIRFIFLLKIFYIIFFSERKKIIMLHVLFDHAVPDLTRLILFNSTKGKVHLRPLLPVS